MPLPAARREIAIRVATMADLPFLDSLQKKHNKALGYFPTRQFEGYIEMGAVLVAHTPDAPQEALGYVIARDRYLKRDELGVIYQLCVVQGDQRKLIGASLIKAVFERAAYGCRLFCCWCAQDLAANYFWESLGFVPVAFRAGSTGKKRVHIFWQRRTVSDDGTPYWYPFQTNAGAIRQDRIVFPIPPGTHWKDVQAVALPQPEPQTSDPSAEAGGPQQAIAHREPREPRAKTAGAEPAPPKRPTIRRLRGLPVAPEPSAAAPAKAPKPNLPKAPPAKIDPKHLAGARELRDRWMEQVNRRILLPASGKYDLSRLPDADRRSVPLLAAG
ncbi:MAG TPA: hypothetical protein VGR35_00830 [Tepidisphaeraceae bacterium]|nr:hypothetical protein [Tepidisphaeraceae bacterium]